MCGTLRRGFDGAGNAQHRSVIATRRLPAGTRLPSSRALAADWGVSRNTVLQVFETLSEEGFLEGRVGDGTYVASALPTDFAAPWVQRGRKRVVAETGYPFRALSQRGRKLIEQRFGGLPERPTPFMPDVPDLRAFPIRSWLRLMNEVSGRLTGNLLVNVFECGL